jgi:hypothetical protein
MQSIKTINTTYMAYEIQYFWEKVQMCQVWKKIQGRNRASGSQSYGTYSLNYGFIQRDKWTLLFVDMMGSIIAGILIIIFLLALMGLGWDTFVSGFKKGADKVGITPIVQGFANSAREIVENATLSAISN